MVVKKRMVTRKRKKREAREWKNEILWQRDREKLMGEKKRKRQRDREKENGRETKEN